MHQHPSRLGPRYAGLFSTLLLLIACVGMASCSTLASWLAPAATAAGSALASYEAAIQNAAKAQGLDAADPRVVAAIERARALAQAREEEQRALEAALAAERAAAIRADIDKVLAELRAQARPCPPAPTALASLSAPPASSSAPPLLVDAGAVAPDPADAGVDGAP